MVKEDVTKFFVTHGKPHHPASKDTLARWVKSMMREAGIIVDIFTPHSIRSASSSKAFQNGMSVKGVLKRGNWTNSKTFKKLYFREISYWNEDKAENC